MWLKVNQIGEDPVWSVKQGTKLWYQTTGSIQLLSVCFLKSHVHMCSVKWRACLQLAMCSVKALFVDDSSSSVALICCSACPLLFCTFSLFMCNVFWNILIIYRTCLFNVHLMLYMFSSPYGLFKSRKIYEKNKTKHGSSS